METTIYGSGFRVHGIWGVWGPYFNIPKAIFYLLNLSETIGLKELVGSPALDRLRGALLEGSCWKILQFRALVVTGLEQCCIKAGKQEFSPSYTILIIAARLPKLQQHLMNTHMYTYTYT